MRSGRFARSVTCSMAARTDPALLDHMLAATVSLVAFEQDETPRTILDRVFRRSVSDEEWRREYAPLFG